MFDSLPIRRRLRKEDRNISRSRQFYSLEVNLAIVIWQSGK
jgi:hypothetical protein